ncbi:unnamed protein product [Dicrocoelium dendriticum]|nr:unnamed protein product [Dicrocoelium dendriticum]
MFPIPKLVLDITSFCLCCCRHLLRIIQIAHFKGNHHGLDYASVLNGDRPNFVYPAREKLFIGLSHLGDNVNCTEEICARFVSLSDKFIRLETIHSGSVFVLRSGLSKVGSRPSSPVPFSPSMASRRNQTIPDYLATTVNHTRNAELYFSIESDTSESSVVLDAPREETFGHLTKHPQVQLDVDPVIRTIASWVDETAHETEKPFFIHLRLIMIYDNESIPIPLTEALPFSCVTRFEQGLREIVSRVHGSLTSTSRQTGPATQFELDLSLLRFHLEILPVFWSSERVFQFNVDECATSLSHTSQMCPQFTCTTFLLDELVNTINSWRHHSDSSSLSLAHKGVLSQLVLKLAWEMQDEVVCCLRLLVPATEGSLQLVLRHIEDTQKLKRVFLLTKRMSGLLGLHFDKNILLSSSTTSGERYCVRNSYRSYSFSMHTRGGIILKRIGLNFVVPAPQAFSKFLHHFEHFSFAPVNARLHYLGGYYFLVSAVKFDEAGLYGTPSSVGVDRRSSLQPPANNSPIGKLETSQQSSTTDISSVSLPLHQDILSCSDPSVKSAASVDPHTSIASHQELHKNLSTHGAAGPTPRKTIQPLSDDDSGDADEVVRFCRRLRAQSFPSARFLSQHLKESYLFDHSLDNNASNAGYEIPPYWLLLRLCTNSVSVFLHHTGTHISQSNYLRDISHFKQSRTLLIRCQTCHTYQFTVKSIHLLMRFVNQMLLLERLRDERICDPLLVPPPYDTQTNEDGVLFTKSPSDRIMHCSGSSTNRINGLPATQPSGRRPSCPKLHTRTSSTSDDTEFERVWCSNPFNSTPLNRRRHLTSAQRTMSRKNSSVVLDVPSWWRPGCFACPVQLTDRIRLHPRLFLATGSTQLGTPIGKGRRIVSALRKLLDKPSVFNQPDMFFLIDFTLRAPDSSETLDQTANNRRLNSMESSPGAPVFYMILKEVTVEAPGKDVCSFSLDGYVSDDFQFTGAQRTPEELRHAADKIGSEPPSCTDRGKAAQFLQFSLHGIEKPSRNLCKFVREMLQSRLDGLVLEHFSDGLSRNAINRLSSADLSFLVSRKSQSPTCHYYIAMPKFLSECNLPTHHPYAPRKLILAFCHYLKQNLSLFLHAVKLDRDAPLFGGYEHLELFLYHRPRAHGVEKLGVATIIFHLLTRSSVGNGSAPTSNLVPHTIKDWSLPNELIPLIAPVNFGQCVPSFDDLYAAVTDFHEISFVEVNSTVAVDQLLISIQIWERGEVDIENLKARIRSTVLHSIYDVITEFFVLTASMKSLVATNDDTNTSEPDNEVQSTLNPYITAVVLPWLRQGRHFDSSLVVKLNLRLASTLFVNQFLVDLLRPFHVTEVPLPSRASRTLDGSLDSMSFFVYHKGSENSSEYRLTGLDRLRGSSVSRPGQFSKFMIIGQNFPTWRRLLGRKIGTAGENSVLGRRRHPSKGVHSDPTHPELGFSSSIATGALLRMQPLLMVFNVPVPRSTPSVIEIDAKQKSCLSNRPIIDFSPSTTTIASPSRAAAAAVSLVTGDSITSDGLPGFCPINFQLPSDVTSIEGEHSEPSGFTLSYPQSVGSPICVADVSVANAAPIAAAVSSAEQFLTVNVQVPRQAYCLFTIEDRQVTVYTYNWSREEVERLAHRCTALADWYNNRVKLLSTLSAQKLGLFHNLDDAFTRGCVSRTATLVYNTCPPELMGPVESPPSTSSLLEKPVWPVSISGTAVPIGTNFVKTQSTRRRYPTSGTDLPTSVSGPGGSVTNTPNASGHVGCTTNVPSSHGGVLSTESQIASVHNFLRLFRDCGCIPPLEPSTTGDLLHRHGRQALAALELDYHRAHQLELMSLPFRAWQAARRHSQPSEPGGVFTGSVTTGSQYSAKNHNPSSGLGSISAEAALASDPLPKRLRRFSSIRMACRLLHTVCTPILFYPAVRAKAVQAARLESITLRRVAEACYAAQQGGLRGGSRPDSDCEASQQQQQQHAYDDDRTLRAGALRAVIRTVQTEAPILPCDHSSTTGNSITGARTLADTLSHTKVQTDLPISGHTQSPLSPWLSWSRNVLLDAAEEPTNSCKEDPNCNIAGEIVPSSKPPGTFGHTHDQYHRAALAFLAEYVRYLQHAVGFHVIPFTDPGAGVSARDQSASSTPTGSYALLHKTIHLAGVHIVEVFIRHFHLHIRLGTLELGRFSRHGSRCLIAGPLSAAVITQAAASAAATAASVRRDAATSMSRVPGLAITNPNIEPLYSGSSRIDHHQQHAISFSWDESSRLCDYTHIHSFSYDYYLRSIQEYLASQRHRRKPGNSASGRKFSNSAFTNAIGITDFPVTDFLSDLHLLSPQPPVFARGCLRSVQLSCPVGAHLRPDQVFHHLIEAHRKYDIQLIRMAKDRNSSTSSASAFPPKLNPSYTYGILELHLTEQGRTTTLDSNRSVRYSSLCDPDSLHSTLLGSSSSHTPTTSAVSGVPNAQLTDPGSNKWGVDASIAAVVVVNERSILNLSAEGIRNNSTDRLLHLIMYLIATDPYNRFPKSSLARMHEPLVSRITNVIQWPAVAPCLDLTTEPLSKLGPKLGRSLSNQGPSTFSTPYRPHSSSSSRSRYTSLTTDLGLEELTAKEQREQNDAASDGAPPLPKDTAEEEVRLHVSYLGTWPAHQVPVQHALESARAIIQERVLHVIKRSELECHKNLLWYRLFDSQQYVNAEYTATFDQPSPRPFSAQVTTPSFSASTVEYGAQPLLEGDNLSITELEELVHSAPFQLNVLDLDLRLCQILQFGACHFAELAQSINLAFIANRLAAASTGKMTSDSVPFACFFQGTPSNDPNPVLCEVDHHIAFFCPNFTTGFVLLSWIQNTEVVEDSNPRAKEDNFKSFQLRVIFRTLGDPIQTDLPQRIIDSKQQTESLFFEHSPLPLVITTIVDKLTFFIWRDMHSRKP